MKRKYKIGYIIESIALVSFLLFVAAFLGVWAGAVFGMDDIETMALVLMIFSAFASAAFAMTFIYHDNIKELRN